MGTWWTSLTARGRVLTGLVAAIALVGAVTAALALSGRGSGDQDVRADASSSTSSSSSSSTSTSSSSTSTSSSTTSTVEPGAGSTTATTRRPSGGGAAPTTTTRPTTPPTQGTTATTKAPPASAPCNTSSSGAAGQLADRFCARRASAGLPKMVRNSRLDAVAQEWAQKMASEHNLSHRTPADLKSRVQGACTGSCTGWAENVAYGSTVDQIWQGWLDSQTHRDNIQAPYAGEFGFGVAQGDDGYLYAVQNFGQYR